VEAVIWRAQVPGRPSKRTPWRRASWCAVDLELTGLDRNNEIIAIGAVPIEEGRVVLGQARYTLVRPTIRPERAAVLVHKLRLADLQDAPALDDALALLLDALHGRAPVFHSAEVERRFIAPALARRRLRMPACADTEMIGRLWLRQRHGRAPANISLGSLARALTLPAEPPHHALGDALTTAQVFIALAGHLERSEQQTVGSLLHAEDRLSVARRFG
jgi:DNA polymerase-3 subunit epsilon